MKGYKVSDIWVTHERVKRKEEQTTTPLCLNLWTGPYERLSAAAAAAYD